METWVEAETNPRIPSIITLLTDFGVSDGYVAAMKGTILNLNPAATLVDVTHEIAPQDVRGAAFVLNTIHRHFPPGTIHVTVVDPGVGTDRDSVVVDTGEALHVTPDNGLLSYLLADKRAPATQMIAPVDLAGTVPVEVPLHWRVFRLAERRYWLPNPSRTFHGRDVFAPVAAYLSLGEPPERFGPRAGTLRSFEVPLARRMPDGSVEGTVIHVDRFGNLITSIRAEDLPRGSLCFEIGSYRLEGLCQTYAERSGLVAVVGSSGQLEIALRNGSAQAVTGLGVGTAVNAYRDRLAEA